MRLKRELLPENFGCGESHPVSVGNRERLSVLAHTECPHCTEQKCASEKADTSARGSLVKRLRHRPLTPKTGVRFPYESPLIGTPERFYIPLAVGIGNDEGPPVPIPNTEVKLIRAENTWLETARENR